MSGFRRGIFERLKSSKLFRRAYVRETVKQGVAHQIRAMRESRNMKQSDLATLSGKSQSNIARLEDPDYGKFTIQTLLDMADAFDVWLSIEFVSFKEGLRRSEDKTISGLNAKSFCDDDATWERSPPIVFTEPIKTKLSNTPDTTTWDNRGQAAVVTTYVSRKVLYS
ncbi:hypothetical protein AU467_19435 [Mesorhizobium loti]|uniref:HTH cro/C1-type domain-containing protein n=1 Tax=Rhizobium loti TaxID=381 RepID=A0A117N3N1_RHILI|nr:hypothetical protein AU467_19435 [Mesorhizobium loti]